MRAGTAWGRWGFRKAGCYLGCLRSLVMRDEDGNEDNKAIIDAINAANPDLLWIGMTAPKQEKWTYSHWDEYNIPLSRRVPSVLSLTPSLDPWERAPLSGGGSTGVWNGSSLDRRRTSDVCGEDIHR